MLASADPAAYQRYAEAFPSTPGQLDRVRKRAGKLPEHKEAQCQREELQRGTSRCCGRWKPKVYSCI